MRRYQWTDISPFVVVPAVQGGQCVAFNLRREGQDAATFSRMVTGRDMRLPGNFGLSPDDLAAVLNRWRGWRTGT